MPSLGCCDFRMRVLIVGNYAYDDAVSMNKFARTLVKGLRDLGVEARLAIPIAIFGRLKPSDHGVGKWLGYLDKFLLFPPYLAIISLGFDIVHIADHTNPFASFAICWKRPLVTCHDLIPIKALSGFPMSFPNTRAKLTGRLYQRMILLGLKKAHSVVCVSEQTRNDLLAFSGKKDNRPQVVPNGLNYQYSPMEFDVVERYISIFGLRKGGFFLHVGNNNFYKNRQSVLRIFARVKKCQKYSDLRLVFAGKALVPSLRQIASDEGLNADIVEIIRPSDEQLRALYSSAKALLFPSFYEGFGWPLIEAQACGCPVITSNVSPMKDIVGDSAVLIDPHDVEGATQTILMALDDLSCYAGKGFDNAKRFTTGSMVSGYLEVYRSILKDRSSIDTEHRLLGG